MQYPRPTTRPRLSMLDLRRPQGQIALILMLTLVLLGVGVGVTLANPIVSLQLSASSDPIVEGNSGNTTVNFLIKLSQAVPAGQSVVIRVDTAVTASNPATLGTDYSATSTDFTFSPGQTQKTFPVTIKGDTVDELNEGFLVRAKILSSTISTIQPPVGSTITTTAIINDDDNPTVATISDPTATEGTNPTIDFVVTLDKASALENISIAYSTVNGTATSGSDFTGTLAGTLLIPKNSLTGTIKIPLLSDAVNEPTESFTLSLNAATSLSVNTPFSDASATGTILDANDAPTDIALSASSIAESQPSGSAVGTLSATDPDSSSFTYSLVSGTGATDNAAFAIVGSSLNTATALNFETKASYSIRVKVTDNGTPAASFQKVFTITVTDVNEAPTNIALSASSIAESAASGSTVGSLSATDQDAGSSFTFALAGGGVDNGSFTIVGTALKTATALDFETKASYAITIQVTDNGTPGLTFTKAFTISVTNVNEAPSDIGLSASSIAESAASGSTVGTLSTTDPDAGSSFTYTLVTGTGATDNGSFAIVGSSLKTATALDFETKASYAIRVRVTDNGTPGLTFEKQFTITVTDVNEAPTNIALSASSIAESAASGSTVGSLSATDADAGSSFTFALAGGGVDNGSFTIVGTSLNTATALDFEAKASYAITIQVTDNGTPGLTFTKAFTITVTNVNEAPTNIALSASSIAESQPSGSTVGSLSATDQDAGSSFTFALAGGGVDNGSFTIVGTALKTATALDFETKTSYAITIQVTDNGTPGLTFTKAFTITVTDVNEAPTDIALSNATLAEAQAAGTAVGTLSATDPDSSSFTYSLVSGTGATDNGSFAIVGSSLNTAAILDFETKASYSIRVKVTDNGTPAASFEEVFTIAVTDVNEAPSDIALSASSIAESQPSGSTVGSLSATDQDAGSSFTFALAGGGVDNGSFTIVGTSLNTATALDFETKASYAITIRVTDNGTPGLTFTKAFTITVTNVNEAPSDIGLSASSIAESQPSGSTVGTLSASDPDVGDTFTYALVAGGADNASFTIVGNALKTAIALDFETKTSYAINVQVTDGGTPGLTFTKAFVITVTDVNEAPVVDADSGTVGIDGSAAFTENGAATAITTANLTVADQEGDQIASATVKITNPQNGAAEALAVDVGASNITASYDAPSGTLTLTGPDSAAAFQAVLQTLTYANSSDNPGISRLITIAATDSGTPAATSSPAAQISLTIAVTDDAPALTNAGLTVAEGGTGNITAAELSASDPDTAAASLVFTIGAAPANGQLLKGGAALGAGDSFTQADIAGGLISYVHDGSNTASDSFSFGLTDGSTTLAGQTFAITVQAVNDAPVITLSGGATGYQLGAPAVAIDPSATVTDGDSPDFAGGQLRVALTGAGAGDVLSVANQGAGAGQIGLSGASVTYGGVAIGTLSGGSAGSPLVITLNASATPAAAQALVRSITFRNAAATTTPGSRAATFTISDGDGLTSAPASKTITFNLPPTAVDDTAAVIINFPKKIDVLANDSDLNGDALTISAVTQGAHGTVTVDAGGKGLTYTPAANYTGGDSFTYTVSDGKGGSDTATVQLTVRRATIFLPMIAGRIAKADLKVIFSVSPTAPQAGKPSSIQLTVTNSGEAAATNFWVDFYLSPSRAPLVNDPWNEVCKLEPCFGLAWFYTGSLQPGQSVVLNSAPQSSANPNGYKADASTWPGYFANGTTKLYAIVDSWNRDSSGATRNPAGAIEERDETNNRAEQNITVTQGTLPPTSQLDGLNDLSAGR